MIEFDSPKEQSSIIKVIGVGGGGSNAVNHMYNQGIQGVDFIICNTDNQALEISPVPIKIQIGTALTEGLGAGSLPNVGKDAALEDIEQIKGILANGTKMVFITAGMGGGTGTGGAPVIAAAAREMGLLTVGIVTLPFKFEGRKRMLQAEQGIEEMRKNVDTLLLICNDKLRELYGNLSLRDAFAKADNVLTTAAQGIAEIITFIGGVNVDFNDVNTVMKNSGAAIMGSGIAEGENRAMKATEMALSSPLLNDSNIRGASNILLYIRSGVEEEISMDEIAEITDYIQEESGNSADIIWGTGMDEKLGKGISITLVATGFNMNKAGEQENEASASRRCHDLHPEKNEAKQNITPSQQEDTEEGPFLLKSESENETATTSPVVEFEVDARKETPRTSSHTEVTSDDDSGIVLIRRKSSEQGEPTASAQPEPKINDQPMKEDESQERANIRIERLKHISDYSRTLKTQDGVVKLENQPAYVRRSVQLNDVAPSSEERISRYSLNEEEGEDNGEKKNIELRSNNSFLHDNVD